MTVPVGHTAPSGRGKSHSAVKRDQTTALVIGAIALIIALAARLPHPLATPGWDGDEGYTLEIAWNLAHGDARMFALEYRFVAHPPLAFAALAPSLRAFGRDLAVVRTVAGIASAIAAALVAWGLARAGLRRAAVLGGFALAVTPFTVAYGRMGYTYGFLALVVAATIAELVAWKRTIAIRSGTRNVPDSGRLTTTAPAMHAHRATLTTVGSLARPLAFASLGPLVDHPGLALPILVGIEARLMTRSWLVGVAALCLGLSPAIIVHGAIAWLDPSGSSEEWLQVFKRLGLFADTGGILDGAPSRTFATTIALAFANMPGLLRATWWMPLAVAGLFAIPERSGRATLLRAFALIALPAFAVRPIDPWFRTAIPLIPIVGWGLGAILDRGVGAAFDVVGATPGRGPLGPRLLGSCLAALLLLPVGLDAGTTAMALLPSDTHPRPLSRLAGVGASPPSDESVSPAHGVRVDVSPERGMPTAPTLGLPIDPWLIRDGDDARAAARWVNARALPTDLVIASPAVTWLVEARVADHLQATSRALPGTSVAFYPPTIAPTRWRFDPSVARARYIILDHITDAWVAADPSTRRVFEPLAGKTPMFRAGAYRVMAGGV